VKEFYWLIFLSCRMVSGPTPKRFFLNKTGTVFFLRAKKINFLVLFCFVKFLSVRVLSFISLFFSCPSNFLLNLERAEKKLRKRGLCALIYFMGAILVGLFPSKFFDNCLKRGDQKRAIIFLLCPPKKVWASSPQV